MTHLGEDVRLHFFLTCAHCSHCMWEAGSRLSIESDESAFMGFWFSVAKISTFSQSVTLLANDGYFGQSEKLFRWHGVWS